MLAEEIIFLYDTDEDPCLNIIAGVASGYECDCYHFNDIDDFLQSDLSKLEVIDIWFASTCNGHTLMMTLKEEVLN